MLEELTKTSHRNYSTGFYFGKENATQTTNTSSYIREYDLLGVVLKTENGTLYAQQRGKFNLGDEVEILQPNGENILLTPEKLFDENGEEITSTTHPMMNFSFKTDLEIPRLSIIRKKAD